MGRLCLREPPGATRQAGGGRAVCPSGPRKPHPRQGLLPASPRPAPHSSKVREHRHPQAPWLRGQTAAVKSCGYGTPGRRAPEEGRTEEAGGRVAWWRCLRPGHILREQRPSSQGARGGSGHCQAGSPGERPSAPRVAQDADGPVPEALPCPEPHSTQAPSPGPRDLAAQLQPSPWHPAPHIHPSLGHAHPSPAAHHLEDSPKSPAPPLRPSLRTLHTHVTAPQHLRPCAVQKTRGKSNKTQNCFFEKISKIDKTPSKRNKVKKREDTKHQYLKGGDTTTDPADIKRIREQHQQHYGHKGSNRDQMGQVLETTNSPKMKEII